MLKKKGWFTLLSLVLMVSVILTGCGGTTMHHPVAIAEAKPLQMPARMIRKKPKTLPSCSVEEPMSKKPMKVS